MKTLGSPLFCSASLDRNTKIREVPSEIDRLLKDPETNHALIWRGKLLVNFTNSVPKIGFLKKIDNFWNAFSLSNFNRGNYLGYFNEKPIFYHDISEWGGPSGEVSQLSSFIDNTNVSHPALPEFHYFRELRSLLNVLTNQDAAILATIKGIHEWNIKYRFCNACGNPLNNIYSGWEKVCTTCNIKHFPRIDPVVIMLICKNNETLLGRSAAWPKGMFSCLAGFMEPGESVELAVARETFEEAGVKVKNTKYVASQPWPFPSSLMIGCYTEAASYKIVRDKNELDDAKWFSKDELVNAMNEKASWWPAREGSIARFMLKAWIDNTL